MAAQGSRVDSTVILRISENVFRKKANEGCQPNFLRNHLNVSTLGEPNNFRETFDGLSTELENI